MGALDVEKWSKHLAAMRSDTAFVALMAERDARRQVVRGEMHELFADLREGQCSLPEFREIFDKRTRKDWDVFGLKGMSGAMFVNTLVKHLSARDAEVSELVRAAVVVPDSEQEARSRMRALYGGLSAMIEAGDTTARAVQVSRSVFFVSGIWHVERPDAWPAYYESMRLTLRTILTPAADVVEAYFVFASTTKALAGALGISIWDLEHLCVWLEERKKVEENPKPPVSPGSERVWLISPGRNADRWQQQAAEGIAAIGWDQLGDLQSYSSIEDLRDALRSDRSPEESEPTMAARACWEFAREIRVGDIIVEIGRASCRERVCQYV